MHRPPLIIATYRLIFTFAAMGGGALFRYRDHFRGITRRDILLTAAAGLFLALHFVTWFESLRYTSVASSVVLVTTQPIFVVIGSFILFRERLSRRSLLGALLAIAGSAIIAWGDFSSGPDPFHGDLLALLAAVMVSGYLIIGRFLRRSLSLPLYATLVYGSSSLFLLGVAMVTGVPLAPYPPADWLLFLGLAISCTLVGHTIFNWAMAYVPASTVSVSVLGEPVGAMIWVSLFLGEYPTLRQLVGGGVIIGGLWFFTRHQNRPDGG
ncbi:MAG: DMT family transporter [Desulfuromonadia bacterium]